MQRERRDVERERAAYGAPRRLLPALAAVPAHLARQQLEALPRPPVELVVRLHQQPPAKAELDDDRVHDPPHRRTCAAAAAAAGRAAEDGLVRADLAKQVARRLGVARAPLRYVYPRRAQNPFELLDCQRHNSDEGGALRARARLLAVAAALRGRLGLLLRASAALHRELRLPSRPQHPRHVQQRVLSPAAHGVVERFVDAR